MTPNRDVLRHISAEAFAALGMPNVAYVKSVRGEDSSTAYEIHAANGEVLGVAPTREVAFAAVLQHEMEPVSAH